MSIFKLLSVLLEYPDEQVVAALPELRFNAATLDGIDDAGREGIAKFLDYVASIDVIDLQSEYVQTFDLTAEHSLHLTHHIFGEDKNRGPALIDLGELYARHGLAVEGNELPDYLPLILEFCHSVPVEEATRFLADAGKVLAVLAANLEKASSPWAALVRATLSLGGQAGPLVCAETESARPATCASATSCGAEF